MSKPRSLLVTILNILYSRTEELGALDRLGYLALSFFLFVEVYAWGLDEFCFVFGFLGSIHDLINMVYV